MSRARKSGSKRRKRSARSTSRSIVLVAQMRTPPLTWEQQQNAEEYRRRNPHEFLPQTTHE